MYNTRCITRWRFWRLAWVARLRPGRAWNVAGWSFVGGTLLFSGSLYALALSGIRKLGAITPFGGVLFLVGWIALAMAAGSLARKGTLP